ncbi:MAG TPA: DUF4157 domain-containing protein [Archangium sp.]|uniref:eCIS core domain-containing protein n=1 Tax=Archangium sp. TaxID=1872627 RepID=UPI002E30F96E|nr:DUF4157 domain-containing protein [Archangium sp.]HEX5749532.1 DUF4157 domain-containing protein [Archangium sp.]
MAAPFRSRTPPQRPPAPASERGLVGARSTTPARPLSYGRAPAPTASPGPVGAVPSVGTGVKLGGDAQTDPRFQRLVENLSKGAAAPPLTPPAAPGGGEPLPPRVQETLGRSLQVNLGGVRVHTDTRAQSAVKSLSARAVTYGSQIFLGPGERSTDLGLMAHEAAHVVQQKGAPTPQRWAPGQGGAHEAEAHRASEAVLRGESFTVRERTSGSRMQRLGIGDALNFFADKANALPGFRLLTLVLGVNPINMSRVERSAANVMKAVVEFIPGGGLITQALENHGIFERVGGWVEEQLRSLGMAAGTFREALNRFLDTLSWKDIFNLGGVWERAQGIFTEPIGRITRFVRGLVGGITDIVKDAILKPLAKLAEGTRGYDLLKAVLGRDPITGEAVPRNAETLIGGFMKLIGQEEVWNNLKKANAVGKAWAWFQGALGELLGFVQEIPGLFMRTLRSLEIADLVLLPRAFAKVAGAFGNFMGRFTSWAGNTVWGLLEIIFSVVAPGVMPYLRRAAGAFRAILRDPIGFAGKLVRAGIQGLQQFAGRFLTHLRKSLIDWLMGAMSGAGIYIPQALELREIVKFVLSVMRVTWQFLRQKLVRVVGEKTVQALETGFELVKTLVTQGPAAAWEKIKESLGNLRDMVMEQIMTFVRDRVVQAAIMRLVTSLNPVGAFIQAIIGIYNTVMFFVERLQQIKQVALSFLESLPTIAGGVIAAAATRVEQTMAGMLTLVISFLARIAGLGRVSDAVLNVVNRVRAAVEKALDRVVDWIVAQAKRLGRFIAQAGVPQDPNERLRLGLNAAATAVNALRGRVAAPVIDGVLGAVRVRYGFQALRPVEQDGVWWIEGQLNPKGSKKTNKETKPTDESTAGYSDTPPIRNFHLAGKKHPITGVPFDSQGYPDFRAAGKVEKEVEITYTGSRSSDFTAANKKAGLKETPKGKTWHHHQDRKTMQLVPTDIHAKTGHTGGFSGGR